MTTSSKISCVHITPLREEWKTTRELKSGAATMHMCLGCWYMCSCIDLANFSEHSHFVKFLHTLKRDYVVMTKKLLFWLHE